MVEIENAENEGPEWQQMVNELNPAILDVLAGDSVNVHCVNSTDFVVGKQTNFNGPVTIINCESNLIEDKIKTHVEDDREKIVIRNKVLSESAATTIQEVAEKKVDKTCEFSVLE